MTQALLQWSHPWHRSLSLPFTPIPKPKRITTISATLNSIEESQAQELTGRERRQLRNERRESNGSNWREEVEERLMKKPKKRYASWTEELNLDNLALLGPQWWVVRVSRVSGQDRGQTIARSLVRCFPDMEFKVYTPAVQVRTKLKNGTYSVKPKPLFPGCVFLRCVLNKELHDFIRECDGVGGFVGSLVGNTKRQINRPKPVSVNDMEAVFRQAKEEQEKSDRAFEEEKQREGILDKETLDLEYNSDPKDSKDSSIDPKPKGRSRKGSKSPADSTLKAKYKLLVPGSTIRVISGTFAEYSGNLRKFNRKTGKATVCFTLLGIESLVDLDVNEIVAVTN